MAKRRKLGRKSGAGFYLYADPAGPAAPHPELAPLIQTYRRHASNPSSPFDRQRTVHRILGSMLIEAARILEMNLVDDPRDVDLCLIYGLAFPKHEGGLLFWADRQPRRELGETLAELAHSSPAWTIPPRLAEWLNGDTPFYRTVET